MPTQTFPSCNRSFVCFFFGVVALMIMADLFYSVIGTMLVARSAIESSNCCAAVLLLKDKQTQ